MKRTVVVSVVSARLSAMPMARLDVMTQMIVTMSTSMPADTWNGSDLPPMSYSILAEKGGRKCSVF